MGSSRSGAGSRGPAALVPRVLAAARFGYAIRTQTVLTSV